LLSRILLCKGHPSGIILHHNNEIVAKLIIKLGGVTVAVHAACSVSSLEAAVLLVNVSAKSRRPINIVFESGIVEPV
jgi:hypothetical protein